MGGRPGEIASMSVDGTDNNFLPNTSESSDPLAAPLLLPASPENADGSADPITNGADNTGSGEERDPESGIAAGHAAHAEAAKKLTSFSLAVIIFYNASGGPFGVEPSIRAAGNLYAIIGFALMPFIWAIPEVIMTSELSRLYPCSCGGLRWVEEAFGVQAGLLVGCVGWIGGVTNNATYPVLFLEYVLRQFYPRTSPDDDLNIFVRYVILAAITLLLSYVNYRGLDVVGKASLLCFFVSMTPFLLLVLLGIPKVDPKKWLETPPKSTVEVFDDDALNQNGWFPIDNIDGIEFRPFVNNLFWNFNNFDQGAHYSASVSQWTLQGGVWGSLFLVSSAYMFPILISTGATDIDQDDWKEGALAEAGTQIAGRWLGSWIVVSSGISLIAMFFAEMSADTLQIMGMADRGQLPSVFGTRSVYGTPTYAILMGMAVILALIPFKFGTIIELANFTYCLAIAVEFLAFAQLRIRRGDSTNLRKLFYLVLIIPPLLYNALVICLASYATYIYSIALVTLIFLLIKSSNTGCIGRQHGRDETIGISDQIDEKNGISPDSKTAE